MRILYTGGGTLGSVTPLLAIHEKINAESLWLGTREGPEKNFIEQAGISFFAIPSYKLRRYLDIRTVSKLPDFFKAFSRTKQKMREFKPNVVLSAGSFTSVPACLAARSLGIPYAFLQLDIQKGLANRIIAPFAQRIFVSFSDVDYHFKTNKIEPCGIPVEKFFLQHKNTVTDNSTPSILFIGGGTGSSWIGEFLETHVSQLTSFAHIIYVRGKNSTERIQPGKSTTFTYKEKLETSRREMADLYASATLVVARAGMGTLSEIGVMGKAAIIVPIPKSHQEKNAKYLHSKKAIETHEQSEGKEKLFLKIKSLIQSPEQRNELSFQISKHFPKDSATCISDQLSIITKV